MLLVRICALSCMALVFASSACSSSSASPASATTTGVNDVRKACEIQATWTARTTTACVDCFAFSTIPKCECSDADYAGRCSDFTKAKTDEPSCQGVDGCLAKCASTDCACIDACYAAKDACRKAAAAADGCVTEICSARCR